MERHTFKTEIDAPREKVWAILWGEKTYSKWTAPFGEGIKAEGDSRAETDWQEGSKVLFLGAEGNGMMSIIEKSNPPEFMSFKHIGIVKDGKEITEGEEVKKWVPAYENYTLKKRNGKTELVIDMDIADEYEDYFLKTWPIALHKLKELSEKKT
ncbi:MAG TPA: SRPBCC domain-containing protein [Flavobacteriaceae bacterium]|nr:SRPBCC domain-containing protein [Flavobacteriaceae bacterium]